MLTNSATNVLNFAKIDKFLTKAGLQFNVSG